MKNILTNKFFIIFILFIAILFSFICNCFATNISPFSFEYNNTVFTVDFSENFINRVNSLNYNYFTVIAYPGTNDLMLSIFFYNEPIYYNTSSHIYTFVDSSVNTTYGFSSTVSSDFSTHSFNISYFGRETSDLPLLNKSGSFVVSSNINILDENGNTVFQGAPAQGEEQQQGETQGIQTLTLEQAQQIPQAMTQTLQVVVPVGITIMAILLVVFLVRYLILRLS